MVLCSDIRTVLTQMSMNTAPNRTGMTRVNIKKILTDPDLRRELMDLQEIKKMSRIERIRTMEALWDSLRDEEPEIESPEWHQDILKERKQKIESGEAWFISLDKLRASRNS
jgi:hypothetical protein